MALAYTGGSGGGGSGGGVQSVTAGDTSIVVAGTATDPTIETADLSTIAADHATAGDVSFNGHKATGLADGVAASDAATFGQIPTVTGGLVKLFEQTLSVAAASIDTGAGGVAAGHGDLMILLTLQTALVGTPDTAFMRFNNDSGANYDNGFMQSIGSTVSAGTSTAAAQWGVQAHGNAGTTGYPAAVTIHIPAYDKTTFFKVGTMFSAVPDGTAGNILATAQAKGWRSTAAISRIAVSGNGVNLQAGSRMVIYGTQ